VIVYHVAVQTADDYPARRAPYRAAHLDRVVALRERGLCVGAGPAPDGKSADLFYRVQQPEDIKRIVEEDPYFTGGAWTGYALRSFAQFLEPWERPPLVTDGSRRAMVVEAETADVEMASFALIEARGAGRMAFGGFFPGGQTLALMPVDDADAAVGVLAETGLWRAGTLRARPLLRVL
jgi:hypothetical protein